MQKFSTTGDRTTYPATIHANCNSHRRPGIDGLKAPFHPSMAGPLPSCPALLLQRPCTCIYGLSLNDFQQASIHPSITSALAFNLQVKLFNLQVSAGSEMNFFQRFMKTGKNRAAPAALSVTLTNLSTSAPVRNRHATRSAAAAPMISTLLQPAPNHSSVAAKKRRHT